MDYIIDRVEEVQIGDMDKVEGERGVEGMWKWANKKAAITPGLS